jgi:hypothetical protein
LYLAEALCSLLLLNLGLVSLIGTTAVGIHWLREQLAVAALARSESEWIEVMAPAVNNPSDGTVRTAP